MSDQLKKIGLTPAKAALMAVLMVGLGVVWGPQLAGRLQPKPRSSAAVAAKVAPPRATRGETPQPPPAEATLTLPSAGATQRSLPTFSVKAASSYDPFAQPAWSPGRRRVARRADQPPEPDELEARFKTLRDKGVAMILTSGAGQAVRMGDQTLRVGDTIDGFRVTEITSDSVVFEPTPDADRDEDDGTGRDRGVL